MTLDLSAPTLKRRAVGMICEKLSGYATIGLIFGAVAMFYAGSAAIGTAKDHWSAHEASATITGTEAYCKLGKLKLGGENKGFKFSDDMTCAEAQALADTPEYDGFKMFEKTRYYFTYTNAAGATVDAVRPSHILGSDTLAAGDTVLIRVDPNDASKVFSPDKPIVNSLQAIVGIGGLLLFLIALGIKRAVRRGR